MNSVEEYARQWAKYEKKKDLDTLSDWIKSI